MLDLLLYFYNDSNAYMQIRNIKLILEYKQIWL